jgi:hypothetical protein
VEDLVARWGGEPFQGELTRWIDEALAPRGEVRAGPLLPEKIRFWSAVFRIPLAGPGPSRQAWCKVGNPGQAFEGELLAALGHLEPDRVVVPWAVSADRGWWLLPDGGPTLDPDRPADWVDLLGDVADLQRASAGHPPVLTLLTTLGPEDAPRWVVEVVDELAALPPQHPQHLEPALAHTCLRRLPRLEEQMAILAQSRLPPTLQPNDVHPRNAVHPATPGGPVRLLDLGDALLGHAWAVLSTPVRFAAGVRLADPWPEGSTTARLVEAYAERWPEVDRTDRAAVVAAADRLGTLHRAASWRRLLAPVDPDRLGVPTPRIATWVLAALA